MTRDDIIRMAHEAGYSHKLPKGEHGLALKRFAALVAAAEREACAKVCDEHWRFNGSASECADAIRARGEK